MSVRPLEPCYVFTVNDSPHPQASVTLGFLNTNFELSRIELSVIPTWKLGREQRNVPECILVPIHFASNDRKERFAVYNDFDTVLLHTSSNFAGRSTYSRVIG